MEEGRRILRVICPSQWISQATEFRNAYGVQGGYGLWNGSGVWTIDGLSVSIQF